MWYLYIIECGDATYYTGITTDLQRRLELHVSGKGAKYCRGRTPLRIVFSQEFSGRSQASRAEIMVKRLSRANKIKLIEGQSPLELPDPL